MGMQILGNSVPIPGGHAVSDVTASVNIIKGNLLVLINNDTSYKNTVTNSYLSGLGPVPGLMCIETSINDCRANTFTKVNSLFNSKPTTLGGQSVLGFGAGGLRIYDWASSLYYDGTNLGNGYRVDGTGAMCATYPTPPCVLQVKLSWYFDCSHYSGAICHGDDAKFALYGQWTISPLANSLHKVNPSDFDGPIIQK